MCGKLEYLEKYSIAPSPSRDYYGLRVVGDQVILYLWRISHGPHKLPTVRTFSFDDFTQNIQLQDEIRRVFGKALLKHIRHIASGRRNTLLTLPRCLIERLIGYLTVEDIVNLSTLSQIAKEIFDDNFVWEVLYKKYNPLTERRFQQSRTTYNWKQLFQQAQMQGLIKVPRARPATKQTKTIPKVGGDSTKASALGTRVPSKAAIENQASKKSSENVRKKIVQTPVPRKSSDGRLSGSATDKEKEKLLTAEKKTSVVRSLQMTAQKNMKTLRQQSSATRIESKHEIKDLLTVKDKASEVKSGKAENKARVNRIEPKASNASLKMLEESEASLAKAKLTISKAVNYKNERAVPRVPQVDQDKSRTKGKTKKIGQSKSSILSTATALLDDEGLSSSVLDDRLDLTDLIEASLKNMRSPRSIFDYSFEKTKPCGGDAKNGKAVEHSRGSLKNGRANATLDRLSEKSEPLTAKSVDSVGKSEASHGSATPKYKLPNTAVTKKPVQTNKHDFNDTMELDAYFERYYDKHAIPSSQESRTQKRSTPRKPIDKLSLLRSLGTKNSYRKMTETGTVPHTNRYELKKAIGSFHK